MKKNIKPLISLIVAAFISMFSEKFLYPFEAFSIPRFLTVLILLVIVILLISFYKIINIEYIYKRRYIIGIIIFTILVFFGFHGSSISFFNQIIQPNNIQPESNPIIGRARAIRGDEWAVGTPTILSQTKNGFNPTSSILNAKTSNITLYPKIVSKSIGTISTPNQIGFLFLPVEQAFSFSWYFGYFLLFFSSLELLMLMTKRKKFNSIIGAILITFSPVVQWWEAWNIIAYGALAIVLFDKYLKSEKIIKQILLAILIGYIGCCYIMCLYPAWQIPYGFLFLILSIWTIKENKENCSIWKILMLILIILFIIAIIVVPIFVSSYDIYSIISHTTYPGKRLSTGGFNWPILFNYLICIFNSFFESSNASEMSQFISLYPVPIIMGIYYWYNNKRKYKKDFLLVGLTMLSILLSVWNYVKLPNWLAKISLLFMSTPSRCAVVVSFTCLLLLIYCLANYAGEELNNIGKYQNLIIAILVGLFGINIVHSNYANYMSSKMIVFDIIVFIPLIFMILLNHKTINKLALCLLALLTLVTGITVHPLNRGLKEIYNKPISKEIAKLEKKDSTSNWATIGTTYYMPNYLVANGADTLNSTSYYPNFDFWNKLDLKKKEDIYNRYAHLIIEMTNKKTSIKLRSEDLIELHINNSDVCKLDLDYLLTTGTELEQYNNEDVHFSKIYNNDGILIYTIKCS